MYRTFTVFALYLTFHTISFINFHKTLINLLYYNHDTGDLYEHLQVEWILLA